MLQISKMLSTSKMYGILFVMLCFSVGYPVLVTAAENGNGEKLRQARLPSTSPQRLQTLSQDPDWHVRREVASNRKASEKILFELARDSRAEVKITVATNLATAEGVFMVLAKDKDINVRSVVARFEFVPEKVLDYLANDPEVDIRIEVARAFNTSEQTLKKLMQDEYPRVQQIAEQTLNNR